MFDLMSELCVEMESISNRVSMLKTIQEDAKPIVQTDISKNKYLEEMSVDEAEYAEEVHDKTENEQKDIKSYQFYCTVAMLPPCECCIPHNPLKTDQPVSNCPPAFRNLFLFR